MNVAEINRRLGQVHAALEALRTEDLSTVRVTSDRFESTLETTVDFAGAASDATLRNAIESVIANIACIKDYFKAWCGAHGATFTGESLINSDSNVALVHDLWNTQKHAVLTKPRSHTKPRIVNVQRVLAVSAGTAAGGFAQFSFDPASNAMTVQSGGGGSVALEVTADVVDESDQRIADLSELCRCAIEAWERALETAGVPLPSR